MSDTDSLYGKKMKGLHCGEDGVLSIHEKLIGWLSLVFGLPIMRTVMSL